MSEVSGAILNGFGTTNVSNSAFIGNTGKGGGAIDNDTTMTVHNSTFYNNSDNGSGGGAVNNFGTMTFIQSTFSGNKAGTGAKHPQLQLRIGDSDDDPDHEHRCQRRRWQQLQQQWPPDH